MRGLWKRVIGVIVPAAVAFAAPPLPGTVLTVTADGAVVAEGAGFARKEAVHLAVGGGRNAPATVRGLPAGDYCFQVTDPSGRTLLSANPVTARRIRVNGKGVLATAPVALAPFADTPHPGGVYRVWVTRVEDYAAGAEESYHGFLPAKSRTANFRVKARGKAVPAGLTVRKFHDSNANGVWDAGEAELTAAPVRVVDPLSVVSRVYTRDMLLAAPAGRWTVTEVVRAGTMPTVGLLDGSVLSKRPVVNPTVLVDVRGDAGEGRQVVFGAVGLGAVRARKIYDRDADGVACDGEPGVAGWRLQLSGTDVTGAAYGPVVAFTGTDGCAVFRDLLPGTYTVRELAPADGSWVATGARAHTVKVVSTLDRCPGPAKPVTVTFSAYRTGRARFGPPAYWRSRRGIGEITEADLAFLNRLAPFREASTYFGAGDEPFDGRYASGSDVDAAKGARGERLAPGGSGLAEVAAFLGDANVSGDARERLAQQLAAFVLNVRHRLDGPGAPVRLADGTLVRPDSLITAVVDTWTNGSDAQRRAAAALLDKLNGGSLAFVRAPVRTVDDRVLMNPAR